MEKRDANGMTESEFLAQYRPGDYERPSVTVDILAVSVSDDLKALKVLLIERGGHPYLGCWAVPGGFVEPDETVYHAAQRELFEETGLKDVFMEQIYTFSKPDRDPRTRVISIAFLALLPKAAVVAGDDAADAAWFSLSLTDNALVLENKDLGVRIEYAVGKKSFKNGRMRYENFVPKKVKSKKALAFDHAEIVLEGMKQLKKKALSEELLFNLVSEPFTLPDLQQVYELILGKSVYPKSFRDSVKNRVESTGEKGKPVIRNRVAELYRWRN